ncbi:hypothetical protein AS9A_1524 [Hoyosella subflava DQS3-9A1]|uniref:Uncharacterized protein n=1 Tax=Hoyosella subflava (strain DSM 45089 / JCM 17490 / NBRC 109087 / DQS3-9A1) TaxID=443218 RepID=F6EI26_HOYSD|nr:hypothetical protein AS9A_1524 [Hoyosella subflava DQS3-9A1]
MRQYAEPDVVMLHDARHLSHGACDLWPSRMGNEKYLAVTR